MPKPIVSVGGVATQAVSLFAGGTDPNVATDNTGFRYTVTIPSGLTTGTYGVRVRFADYGYISDNNYVADSYSFKTVQIGSATAEPKVSGDCTRCHGTGNAPFHQPRISVVFDTDQCNGCHDYSGGHAAVLANRVHAVHAASKTGDMLNEYGLTPELDWSDVTYPLGLGWPGGIGRCDICHSSGNTSYRSVTHEVACLGCHGDRPGATDHMLQNGGDYPVIPETTPAAP
jgi:hypothetical protein